MAIGNLGFSSPSAADVLVRIYFNLPREGSVAVKKAVWLTNVDSQVMNSRENLAAGLSRLAELGARPDGVAVPESHADGQAYTLQAVLKHADHAGFQHHAPRPGP